MNKRALRNVWRAVGAVALIAALPGPVAAQAPALGEVARKEAERRKATPAPKKAYTNADLPESARVAPVPAPAPAASTPVTEATPQAADAKPQGEERDEAWWRARMAQLREELRRNEVFLEALQSRINSLSADFLNRDDPYQRAKVGEDRAKAAAEMARVTEEVAKGRQAIADLEEEARKSGVPPGWLR